jgi:ribosome biogenesis GTPase / thiamine phosphate phosphatase
MRGRLFEESGHEKRPIAVGDRVQVRFDSAGGIIEAVLPRTTQLHRRAASEGEAKAQVLAANISLVLVVTAVAQPPFQPDLVDGVLAAAEREHIPAAIVLTKVDLAPDAAERWAAIYRRIGYQVFATSTAPASETPDSLAELARLLHANRSVLCGLSGVGKSTLLNRVIAGLELRVGSLNHIQQGRHTTTHTQLIPLPLGGHVLDTPGVRNFHLFHVGAQELSFLFPEIRTALPGCEYSSCTHIEEPDCAVLAAVASGTIARSRYDSYRFMVQQVREEEHPERHGENRNSGRRGPRQRRRPRHR